MSLTLIHWDMDKINSIPALVQIMAWCLPGDKPLSEPMMVSFLTHIYAPLGLSELRDFLEPEGLGGLKKNTTVYSYTLTTYVYNVIIHLVFWIDKHTIAISLNSMKERNKKNTTVYSYTLTTYVNNVIIHIALRIDKHTITISLNSMKERNKKKHHSVLLHIDHLC